MPLSKVCWLARDKIKTTYNIKCCKSSISCSIFLIKNDTQRQRAACCLSICKSLEKVILPSSLKYLGEGVFYKVKILVSLLGQWHQKLLFQQFLAPSSALIYSKRVVTLFSSRLQNFLLKGKENGNYFLLKGKVFPFSPIIFVLLQHYFENRRTRFQGDVVL